MKSNLLGRRFVALIAATLLATAQAWATPGNQGGGNGGCGQGQQTNGCAGEPSNGGAGGAGGQGGSGGAGGNGTGLGVGIGVGVGLGVGQGGDAKATGGNARSDSSSVSRGGDAQANASATNSASSKADGGAGGTAAAKSGDISIRQGDVTYKEAAQTAYAPEVPTVAKSCRLFLGGGASSRDGSASGVVPLWKDQECLSVTGVQLAIEVNSAARRHGQRIPFPVEDIAAMACKIEGMAETMVACGKK